MITLKQALKLNKEELSSLRNDIKDNILKNKELGAYVEQFTQEDINLSLEDGIPIALKANMLNLFEIMSLL